MVTGLYKSEPRTDRNNQAYTFYTFTARKIEQGVAGPRDYIHSNDKLPDGTLVTCETRPSKVTEEHPQPREFWHAL